MQSYLLIWTKKNVRVYNKWQIEPVKLGGGKPVLIKNSQQYLAYKNPEKNIQFGFTGLNGYLSKKIYEVAKYATLTFDSSTEFVAVMDARLYSQLDRKYQDIIMHTAREIELRARDTKIKDDALALAKLKSKISIRELNQQEKTEWFLAYEEYFNHFVTAYGAEAAAAFIAISKLNKLF